MSISIAVGLPEANAAAGITADDQLGIVRTCGAEWLKADRGQVGHASLFVLIVVLVSLRFQRTRLPHFPCRLQNAVMVDWP